jgi:hypothetical protein
MEMLFSASHDKRNQRKAALGTKRLFLSARKYNSASAALLTERKRGLQVCLDASCKLLIAAFYILWIWLTLCDDAQSHKIIFHIYTRGEAWAIERASSALEAERFGVGDVKRSGWSTAIGAAQRDTLSAGLAGDTAIKNPALAVERGNSNYETVN